jgi:hypothetical protein
MEQSSLLSKFLSAIDEDPRISITHIGIYVALLEKWRNQNYKGPLQVYSYEIMRLAKISASTTYHKIIRQLSLYGYVKYEPSYKRNQGSKVYILCTD